MNQVRSVRLRLVHALSHAAFAVSTLICLSIFVTPAFAQYNRADLVSNQAGVAPGQDGHLVNGWGLVALPTSPFWVSDNGTGFSTLYDGAGQQVPLIVTIPPAPSSPAGTLGTPTGVVGNISPNPTDFTFTNKENGKSGPAMFIFATLDGTISAWNFAVDGIDPTTGLSHATIIPAADRSGVGAVYSGLAIAVNSSGKAFLYAADDGPNRRIDVFNDTFTHIQSFEDPDIPRDFAPYGIQAIGGQIWVTYTALNKAQGGFVDVFDTEGTLVKHFAAHGPLHSPWGLAQAPPDFGPMSNAILITNNISRGRINAFNAQTGQFLGPLRDAHGNPIEIDNVWALQFGHGQVGGPPSANGTVNQLFFTAGPNGYANGLFGVITFGQ